MFDNDVPVTLKKIDYDMLLLNGGLDKLPKMSKEVLVMQSALKTADGVPFAWNVIGGKSSYSINTRRLNNGSIWSHVCR